MESHGAIDLKIVVAYVLQITGKIAIGLIFNVVDGAVGGAIRAVQDRVRAVGKSPLCSQSTRSSASCSKASSGNARTSFTCQLSHPEAAADLANRALLLSSAPVSGGRVHRSVAPST